MDVLSLTELSEAIRKNGKNNGALTTLNISQNMMKLGCLQGE